MIQVQTADLKDATGMLGMTQIDGYDSTSVRWNPLCYARILPSFSAIARTFMMSLLQVRNHFLLQHHDASTSNGWTHISRSRCVSMQHAQVSRSEAPTATQVRASCLLVTASVYTNVTPGLWLPCRGMRRNVGSVKSRQQRLKRKAPKETPGSLQVRYLGIFGICSANHSTHLSPFWRW